MQESGERIFVLMFLVQMVRDATSPEPDKKLHRNRWNEWNIHMSQARTALLNLEQKRIHEDMSGFIYYSTRDLIELAGYDYYQVKRGIDRLSKLGWPYLLDLAPGHYLTDVERASKKRKQHPNIQLFKRKARPHDHPPFNA